MGTRHRGFTLIEVLLVLVLGGLLVGLVAPLGVTQVDKARAQTEWLTLEREVRELALRAFLTNDYLTLEAAGQELAWQYRRGEAGALRFEQLYFTPEQLVRVNPNGIPDKPHIELLQRERSRQLDILPADDL